MVFTLKRTIYLVVFVMLSAVRSFSFRTRQTVIVRRATTANVIYDHSTIESKWQTYWDEHKSFATVRREGKEKKYVLDMFPYPSGSGLHVGHPEGYTASDIMARYWRMCDYDVLHPMGWDAFGLPAEQYAIQTGIPPEKTTKKNIVTFKRQLKSLGFSIDWDREIATTDESYFRWTQWLFLRLFKAGFVEQSHVPVNWCAGLGSVLANEEIIGGVSERGGYPVERLPLRQWVMKITKFGEQLEQGLEGLDWPQGTLAAQKSWIGRSEGAEVNFRCNNEDIWVFTTRPDTLLGVTYLVLAPENPLISKIVPPEHAVAVQEYVRECESWSDMDRIQGGMAGLFIGATATHPITHENIPIWVGRHVLGGYGTGAMMAVPTTDQKDMEFAELNNIPIHPSDPSYRPPCSENQEVIIKEKTEMITLLAELNMGRPSVQYRLRDWVFSRQRYWGEPIPIFFPVDMENPSGDPRKGDAHEIKFDSPIPVPDDELPIRLPVMDDITPGNDPAGCLAKCVDWRFFKRDGQWFARETNTMPQWAGSCWYYLRFTDSKNSNAPWSAKSDEDWMPVDLYIGGAEHAVLHLLYARFWHKIFHQLGLTSCAEPFTKLVHQGMILGSDGEKMSKSRGNVVNPDDVVEEYGADVLRLYEMFMGPLEAVKPWQTEQITGVVRFRNRVYTLATKRRDQMSHKKMDQETAILLHQTMKKVTGDIEKMSFNTAISSIMILCNHLSSMTAPPVEAIESMLIILSPLAPHLCEECWEHLGNRSPLAVGAWVQWDEALCQDTTVKLAVQVNGKTKGVIEIGSGASETQAREVALSLPSVNKVLGENSIKRVIYVPGKVLNLVVK